MWYWNSDTMLMGFLFAALFMLIVIGLCWVFVKFKNKNSENYQKENPDVATIWIVQERHWGVKIKKVDGKRAKSFENGINDADGGVYIQPGRHVLLVKHEHANPEVVKDRNYKKQRFSEFEVLVEAGKDYTIQFNEYPGDYVLIEGKPVI